MNKLLNHFIPGGATVETIMGNVIAQAAELRALQEKEAAAAARLQEQALQLLNDAKRKYEELLGEAFDAFSKSNKAGAVAERLELLLDGESA